LSSSVKCKRCKSREATGEDELCNNCRFVLVLDDIAEERAVTRAREQMKREHTR